MSYHLDLASEDNARLTALEREVTRLRKINRALMERVERSMDAQGSAFSLFQTAIVLETKVRERTTELERTLADLERSYRELGEAKAQAETAQTRLMAALDSASDGFALFDGLDRLVLFNARYLTFWPGMSEMIRTGMTFGEIARLAVEHKAVIDAYRQPEEWVQRRLRQHANSQGPSIHALSDGRWIQVDEKRTRDGGIVCIYTDITDLKRRETLQRETALAEKSNLLQATLDNIFEGVAVYDRDLVLVAWNNEFLRLFDLPAPVVRGGARFEAFAKHLSGLGTEGMRLCGKLEPRNRAPLRFEVGWSGGLTLEAQRNPMPDGGFVLTFADITQRKLIEAALQDAKETLEDRVEERTAALTLANERLQNEIAERRDVEAALQIAKSEAEQANLSKTKFLAAASHDLLQPLNAARLFVSALGEREQNDENAVLIANLDESLAAVEDLLGALLDISRLDAGAVSPEFADFEVSAVLSPLTTEYTALAAERGLQLRSVPSHCVVRSDLRLLRCILQNFLSNAIRYTARGRVLLGCRRVNTGLRIEVWDTGPGIFPDKLDEIFEEFRRLHNAPEENDHGIGLGLAIVKRIARTLDVPIGVRSWVGRGSVFFVTVPYGETLPLPQPAPTQDAAPERLSGSVILVIDNERSILTAMHAMLSGWKYDVHVASSGAEAVEMLPSLPRAPDLLIADYHLEEGTLGTAELQRISEACGRALPGIIITANRASAVKAAARRHGYRVLNKPVKPAQLRSLIMSMLD